MNDVSKRTSDSMKLQVVPPPHYIALFTLLDKGRSALSAKGDLNYRTLAMRVGADHLHMFAVQARRVLETEESCEIQSYAVHPPEV